MDEVTSQMYELNASESMPWSYDPAIRYTMSALQLMLGVFILMGNVLTILAIVTTPGMNTEANRYLLHLAVADSVVGVSACLWGCSLLDFTRSLFHRQEYLCLFTYATTFISSFQSLTMLTVMAVDRLIFVERPFLHVRLVTERLISAVIAGSWLISIIYGGLIQMVFSRFNTHTGCTVGNVMDRHVVKIMWPIPFFTVVVITSACYVRIACIARYQRKQICTEMQRVQVQHHQQTQRPQPEEQHDNGDHNQRQQRNSSSLNCSQDRRVCERLQSTGLFIVLNSLYCLSWAPLMVYIAARDSLPHISNLSKAAIVTMGLSNSGMNFIVYACKNKQLARAYKRLLRRCCHGAVFDHSGEGRT